VELQQDDPRIIFFECPVCLREYALIPGKELTFRWLHPIGLALYCVTFDRKPTERVAEVASSLLRQRQPADLEEFVREIRLELNEPTQQVRDILDLRASEQELREYLGLLCERLEQTLSGQRH
jgi:hypothetical protein